MVDAVMTFVDQHLAVTLVLVLGCCVVLAVAIVWALDTFIGLAEADEPAHRIVVRERR
jgi:hypothetical protein